MANTTSRQRRNNGNGSITYIPGRNRWRAFWTTPAGKRLSKYCATQAEADDWLASQRAAVADGTFIEPSLLTLGAYITVYLDTYTKDLKPRTLLRYVGTAKYLFPIFEVPLQHLSAVTIQRAINALDTPSKRHKAYVFLRMIIGKAAATDIIPKNIMLAVEPPKYESKRLETFSTEEVKRIKAALALYPDDRAFYLTLFATGCRLAELCGLHIDNVYADHIRIDNTVYRIKGGWQEDTPKTKCSTRDVYLPPNIIAMLKEQYHKPPLVLHGFVFHRKDGQPYLQDVFQRKWRNILAKAEVPYRNIHYIRHTHATELLHQFDFVEVQHRLGHSRPSTTLDMYGHTKEEYNNKIVAAVADWLS